MKKLLTLLFAIALTFSLSAFAQSEQGGTSSGSTASTSTSKTAKTSKKKKKKAAHKKVKKSKKKAGEPVSTETSTPK